MLVPAYLLVVPLEYDRRRPLHGQVEVAMPLLEAVEHAALRAGVPVDARIERGRTPIDALRRLWEVERSTASSCPRPRRATGLPAEGPDVDAEHAPAETLVLSRCP